MNVKFGFIGCGKMASAIIKGISGNKNTLIKGSEINPEIASDAFVEMESDYQEKLIKGFSDSELTEILEDMTFSRNIPTDIYYDEYVAAMHKIYREKKYKEIPKFTKALIVNYISNQFKNNPLIINVCIIAIA